MKNDLLTAEKEIRKQMGNIDLLNERVGRHEQKISDLEQEAEFMRLESIETLKRFNDEKETTLMLRAELRATNEALMKSKEKAAGLAHDLDDARGQIASLQSEQENLQNQLAEAVAETADQAARYESR